MPDEGGSDGLAKLVAVGADGDPDGVLAKDRRRNVVVVVLAGGVLGLVRAFY